MMQLERHRSQHLDSYRVPGNASTLPITRFFASQSTAADHDDLQRPFPLLVNRSSCASLTLSPLYPHDVSDPSARAQPHHAQYDTSHRLPDNKQPRDLGRISFAASSDARCLSPGASWLPETENAVSTGVIELEPKRRRVRS